MMWARLARAVLGGLVAGANRSPRPTRWVGILESGGTRAGIHPSAETLRRPETDAGSDPPVTTSGPASVSEPGTGQDARPVSRPPRIRYSKPGEWESGSVGRALVVIGRDGLEAFDAAAIADELGASWSAVYAARDIATYAPEHAAAVIDGRVWVHHVGRLAEARRAGEAARVSPVVTMPEAEQDALRADLVAAGATAGEAERALRQARREWEDARRERRRAGAEIQADAGVSVSDIARCWHVSTSTISNDLGRVAARADSDEAA